MPACGKWFMWYVQTWTSNWKKVPFIHHHKNPYRKWNFQPKRRNPLRLFTLHIEALCNRVICGSLYETSSHFWLFAEKEKRQPKRVLWNRCNFMVVFSVHSVIMHSTILDYKRKWKQCSKNMVFICVPKCAKRDRASVCPVRLLHTSHGMLFNMHCAVQCTAFTVCFLLHINWMEIGSKFCTKPSNGKTSKPNIVCVCVSFWTRWVWTIFFLFLFLFSCNDRHITWSQKFTQM